MNDIDWTLTVLGVAAVVAAYLAIVGHIAGRKRGGRRG